MTAQQEKALRDRYADEKNAALAKDLGISVRTLQRWAGEMGLRKSDAFMRMCRHEADMKATWLRLCGKRVGGFEKGRFKGVNWGSWKKGEKAFSGELEEKRVKALRERGMDERRRMRNGEERKTRWRMWPGWKNFGK